MRLRITCRDGGMGENIVSGEPAPVLSKFAERDIVGKIAEKFADTLMESIDMIFDMLLEPGTFDSQKVSKARFKDYVLQITSGSLRE